MTANRESVIIKRNLPAFRGRNTDPGAQMSCLPSKYADLHRFRFGDSREICDWLTGLALGGRKTGTCWAHRDVARGEPMFEIGDRSVYTDWDHIPVCAVEYTKIEIHPFDQVPVAFALSEGEGDYVAWRNGHIAWFQRTGGWSPDMAVVCESFKVIDRF